MSTTGLYKQTTQLERTAPLRKLWRVALLAGGAAFAGSLVVFWIARLANLSLAVPASPASQELVPLAVGMIAAATFLPALGAALLLAVLGRFTRRPIRIFQVIAALVLLLSLGGPLSLPASGAVKLVLVAMHIVTAASIVGVLSRFGREP